MKLLHVAVGIVINQRQEVLIAQRQAHKSYAGCWEFPGGKVESEETVIQALKRELMEEVALNVLDAAPFMQLTHSYPEFQILLDIYEVKKFEGCAISQEGQAIAWVALQDLPQANLLPANQPIVSRLLESIGRF